MRRNETECQRRIDSAFVVGRRFITVLFELPFVVEGDETGLSALACLASRFFAITTCGLPSAAKPQSRLGDDSDRKQRCALQSRGLAVALFKRKPGYWRSRGEAVDSFE